MISVIIPYYNARIYVEDAVKSALSLGDVVSEIIVIYDGCRDLSFKELEELFSTKKQVRIIHHVDFRNLGSGASRNLGIRAASSPWIAFLDADDYFLPNRFDEFLKVISRNIEFDGLYESVQYFNGSGRIYGVTRQLSSDRLLHFLIRGTYGHFHTNGFIVKRDLLLKSGLFVESLRLHQDSDLWLKLAFYGRLISGIPGVPVAMVRKHEGNRIWKGTTSTSKYEQLSVSWRWAKSEPIGLVNKFLLFRKMIKYKVESSRE